MDQYIWGMFPGLCLNYVLKAKDDPVQYDPGAPNKMANEFSLSEVKFVSSGKCDLLKLSKIMGHPFS